MVLWVCTRMVICRFLILAENKLSLQEIMHVFLSKLNYIHMPP